jgi:HPt (histidine-containing phosphotransfer) domain-containing protein
VEKGPQSFTGGLIMADVAHQASGHDEIAEPVAGPPLAPVAQPIDWSHLERMTLGERSLEREIVALFDRQAGMLVARMGGEPRKVVGALAHTLGGSARGIGAWHVADAAEELERLAASPAEVTLEDAMHRVAAAVAEARAMITQILSAR